MTPRPSTAWTMVSVTIFQTTTIPRIIATVTITTITTTTSVATLVQAILSTSSAMGPPAVNYNIPSIPNSSIGSLPHRGVAIFHGVENQSIDFCEKLQQTLEPYPPGACQFENIDVSSVPWSILDLSVLFDVLRDKQASTRRLKAFKCGLDDEGIGIVAGWLATLPHDSLPDEIHLSHNKITQDGFHELLCVIERKRAEPASEKPPVWLRMENNQVDGDVLASLTSEGRICQVASIKDQERFSSNAAVAMPSFSNSKGRPPARVTTKFGVGPVRPPGQPAWDEEKDDQPKTTLNNVAQKYCERRLTKTDIVYTNAKVGTLYQAIVKLNFWDGRQIAGELTSSRKDAEKSAAIQTLKLYSSELEICALTSSAKRKTLRLGDEEVYHTLPKKRPKAAAVAAAELKARFDHIREMVGDVATKATECTSSEDKKAVADLKAHFDYIREIVGDVATKATKCTSSEDKKTVEVKRIGNTRSPTY